LLQSLPDDAQLAAGFDDDELGELMKSLEPQTESASQQIGDYEYRVIVQVDGETSQAKLIARLEKEGYTCQPLMS